MPKKFPTPQRAITQVIFRRSTEMTRFDILSLPDVTTFPLFAFLTMIMPQDFHKPSVTMPAGHFLLSLFDFAA